MDRMNGYIWVGNIEASKAEKRIADLMPIDAVAMGGAKCIHGRDLPDHVRLFISNKDYDKYNNHMDKYVRSIQND
jgi:hypothetical protein